MGMHANVEIVSLAKKKGYTKKGIGRSVNRNYHPTLQDLQTWLRETYEVIVTIRPYEDTIDPDEKQLLWEDEVMEVKEDYNVTSTYEFYHSYEEALECGLGYALTLI